MNRVAVCLTYCLIILTLSAPASADLVTLSSTVRKVTGAEAGNGAPVDGDVYQFKVTTDGDIFSINTIKVTLAGGGALYNNAFGDASDAEPGSPLLIPVFPAVGVDSWITTPGATSLLGAKLPGDGVDTTYGDLTNDGPQQDFVFAQLTVPAGSGFSFVGAVSIAGGGARVYTQPFNFVSPIPEPASIGLATAGLFYLVTKRRRMAQSA